MLKMFRSVNLKNQLLISYIVLIALPLLLFSQLFFREVSALLEQKIIYSATQSFDQGTDYVAYKIDKIIKISDQIAVDSRVKEILERDVTTTQNRQLLEDHYDLKERIKSYEDDQDIKDIVVFINPQLPHDDMEEEVNSIDYAMKQHWYSQLPGAGSRVFMVPPLFYTNPNTIEEPILSLARRITGSTNYVQVIGYLRIDFAGSTIGSILTYANAIHGSLTYIRNRDDRIVSSTNMEMLGNYQLSLQEVEWMIDKTQWEVLLINDEPCYVKTRLIPDTDWTIITIIPKTKIYEEVAGLVKLMYIFLLLILPAAIVFSIFFANQITKRLSVLSGKMKLVTENIYDEINFDDKPSDELSELAGSYNFMVKRIENLAKSQYQLGLNMKSTELELLHAQINPHFLYNTMDMINWMSYENKGEEIRKITKALSTFYKLSLSRGESLISIKDELTHVGLYMEIQNHRLEKPIDYRVYCPIDLQMYLIPKITLQPIVENAVVHGILNKKDKEGTITISCQDDKEEIRITIKDNGVGISQETVETILLEDHEKGFGLRNIHARLLLTYNERCGLYIESKENEGTSVEVRLTKRSMV
jgi:two-component system sensor histidine kinase YesM